MTPTSIVKNTTKPSQKLEQAVKTEANFPSSFNLGSCSPEENRMSMPRAEFQKDVAIEPDLAENDDQLGPYSLFATEDAAAEKI
jgi:hypothetical protein